MYMPTVCEKFKDTHLCSWLHHLQIHSYRCTESYRWCPGSLLLDGSYQYSADTHQYLWMETKDWITTATKNKTCNSL